MNIFNRVVTVLLIIAFLLVTLALAVFPLELVGAARRGLDTAGAFLQTMNGSYFTLFIVARVGIVLFCLIVAALLLWGELRPQGPRTVRVHTEAGSMADVTADSVARRLAWHIDQLADVVSVSPSVRAHGRSVDVRLLLRTAPEIDVPMKTDEVVALTREVIADRMGLQPGKIEVHMEHAPYDNVEA